MAGDTPRGICAVPKPPYTPLVTLAIVSVSMIVTQIGWSGFSVFVKATTASAEHHVDPLVFSLLRDAGAVPVLLLAAVLFDGLHQIKLKDMPILALGGSIGLFANQLLYLYGVYLANASDSGIVQVFPWKFPSNAQPLNPVITCILSVIIGAESLGLNRVWGWLKLFGIAISVGGTLWLWGMLLLGSIFTAGMLVLLGSVFASSSYIIFQKKYIFIKDADGTPNYLYPPITATAYMYWFASLELGIAAFIKSFIDVRTFSGLDAEITFPILYAIFIASALGYCLVSYSNTLTTPTVVTAFWPLQSLATILFSWLFLGEEISWVTGVCAAMIIIGLFSVCFAKYKEETLQELETKLGNPEEDTSFLVN